MNSKDLGDIGEVHVMLALIKKGYHVSIPFDDNSQYDLIVDIDNKLYKIQCKYASMNDKGAITLYRYSTTRRAHKNSDETVFKKKVYDSIDFMAVYCPDTNEVYMVPIKDFKDKAVMTLRIKEPENGQVYRVNFADNYKVS